MVFVDPVETVRTVRDLEIEPVCLAVEPEPTHDVVGTDYDARGVGPDSVKSGTARNHDVATSSFDHLARQGSPHFLVEGHREPLEWKLL